MIKILAVERGSDKHGSGAFGASRGDRIHKGIDYACYPGSRCLSVTCGKVTKIGYPYSQEDPKIGWPKWKVKKHNLKKAMRYVQITDSKDYHLRYMYLDPTVILGQEVKVDDILGITQDLITVYPGMTGHVHFDVKKDGEYINPNDYFDMIKQRDAHDAEFLDITTGKIK